MRLPRLCLALLLTFLLSACTAGDGKAKKDAGFFLKSTSLSSLPGWQEDSPSEALAPLALSCDALRRGNPDATLGPLPYAGTYADWQAACERLPETANDAAARKYFTDNFAAYEIWSREGRDGLFTGYYEPILKGALTRKKPYVIPLYARPHDLITVTLGDFRQDLKGETVFGRVKANALIPYFTREEIEKGALKKEEVLAWVDDAVDAFFLHIQGSGQVVLPGGKTIRVGYAAANGRAYYAIGRELIKRGALTKDNVSMQAIRAWLEAHPKEAQEVMNLNASYVFFHRVEAEGPLGAQGVPLTPQRSLAVDRKKIPYGAPVFIDAEAPEGGGRLQRLMIAQDTGGAITGAVRGDFFWGAGAAAAHKAGIMKSAGQSYILLPKAVTVPEKFSVRPWWMRALDFGGVSGASAAFVYNR
jgi:membrane-bound lytic murein transglycosylase A